MPKRKPRDDHDALVFHRKQEDEELHANHVRKKDKHRGHGQREFYHVLLKAAKLACGTAMQGFYHRVQEAEAAKEEGGSR
eukprot:scaffold123755_cov15-Tisochrysis_lutea.AAC.1